MMHIWELLVDYIYPPSIHTKLVRSATTADIRKEYYPASKNGIHYFSSYKRKLIRATVTTTKFNRNQKATRLLATLLSTWLCEHPIDTTLLIPIPLHYKRERERGYNQVTQVLEELTLPNVMVHKKILQRSRHTIAQTKLTKTDRQKNIINAFSVDTKKLQSVLSDEIKRVIICDDVYTTGSTLKAARLALAPHLPADCSLICLAWAH